MSPQEIDDRVKRAADLLGIHPLLHRKPRELSGGQRQRVAMGRAIVRRPQVFLMDEPLSNLDAKLRVQMRAELQKLHRTLGVTTLYVTHDQTEAMTLGSRICLMKNGVIQQVDTPLNLYEHPANLYVAGFIGSPAMNFVNATLAQSVGGLEVVASGFRARLPQEQAAALGPWAGRAVIFGIRPEHIYEAGSVREDFPTAEVKAQVEVYEPMGSEVYLYVSAGGDQLVARVDAHTRARVGETVTLHFDLRKSHMFDPQTEESLTARLSTPVSS
jgi:multiple sugar transport system ATP-binding protein